MEVSGCDGQWPSGIPSRHASCGLTGREIVVVVTMMVDDGSGVVDVDSVRVGRGRVGGVGGLAVD